MRNRICILTALLGTVFAGLKAQPPQGMNYQAVARNAAGQELQNQFISVRLTIHTSTSGGNIAYQETDTATTNKFGLFSVVIGSGTPVTGTFSSINWSAAAEFLQVELDPAGGSNYDDMGTSQLQSVPYALSALSNPEWTTLGNNIINNNSANVGIGSVNPNAKLNVQGTSGEILTIEGVPQSWMEYINAGVPIGYFGNWNGTANDLDVGTSQGVIGNFNLATQALPRITIDSGGHVGIGIAPFQEHLLEINGDVAIEAGDLGAPYVWLKPSATDSVYMFASSGYIGWISGASGTNPTTGIFVNRTNNDIEPDFDNQTSMGSAPYRWSVVYAGNGVIQTSDERLKKNIADLNLGLPAIMQLRPVSYEWKNEKDGAGPKIGFIAQEVENVIPQAVVHDHITDKQIEQAKAAGKPVSAIKDPYGMNYSEIIPVLVKAMQELNIKNEVQEKEINALKANLEKLEQK